MVRCKDLSYFNQGQILIVRCPSEYSWKYLAQTMNQGKGVVLEQVWYIVTSTCN